MSKIKSIQKNRVKNAVSNNKTIMKANTKFLEKQIALENETKKRVYAEERIKAQAIADKAMPDLKKLARKQTIGFLMVVATMTLRDTFGMGRKRLERFYTRFSTIEYLLKDSLLKEDNPVTVNDLFEQLKEETGLDIFKFMREVDSKCHSDDANGTWKAEALPDIKG